MKEMGMLKIIGVTFVVGVMAMAAGCMTAGVAGNEEPPPDIYMGDWQGEGKLDGQKAKVFAQIIALGDGQYRANILSTLEKRVDPEAVLDGKMADGKVSFSGSDWTAVHDGKSFVGSHKQEAGNFTMTRLVRVSPTMGKKPPRGAVVLFDGKSTAGWYHPGRKKPTSDASGASAVSWKLLENGAMEVARGGSIKSTKAFTDHFVHVEFRTPFMPKARGQGRGNSGVYLQGFYEVQVLDSYGLAGRDNECGGIYKVAAPTVNMCLPPMQWQTYDIDFKAARFDENGNIIAKPQMTVTHNGVKIHDAVEVPKPTQSHGSGDVKQAGGLYLQDHGNPVQYRNIWVAEK
jgi:hypothetical protein